MTKRKQRNRDRPSIIELTQHLARMVGETEDKFRFDGSDPEHTHDCLECLKISLQTAIDVEFSTIPPYLCALWSIKDELHPAAKSIREVVQEEMLHMALACNLLTAIGGVPEISFRPPTYPAPLPGGLHQGLVVTLSGLSFESLEAFMRIETPKQVFPLDPDEENWPRTITNYGHETTIGEFYDKIKRAMQMLDPPLSQEVQVTGPLAYANVGDQAGVEWAIDLISHQGEGSTMSPFENEQTNDLAHFYRFAHVYVESELIWSRTKQHFERGKPAPLPDVWPMGAVSENGWDGEIKKLEKKVREKVTYHLDQFDTVYSKLLDLLQATWTARGGQAALIEAYETMFKLQDHALPLMQVEIPGGDGKTFGPRFRYRSRS